MIDKIMAIVLLVITSLLIADRVYGIIHDRKRKRMRGEG